MVAIKLVIAVTAALGQMQRYKSFRDLLASFPPLPDPAPSLREWIFELTFPDPTLHPAREETISNPNVYRPSRPLNDLIQPDHLYRWSDLPMRMMDHLRSILDEPRYRDCRVNAKIWKEYHLFERHLMSRALRDENGIKTLLDKTFYSLIHEVMCALGHSVALASEGKDILDTLSIHRVRICVSGIVIPLSFLQYYYDMDMTRDPRIPTNDSWNIPSLGFETMGLFEFDQQAGVFLGTDKLGPDGHSCIRDGAVTWDLTRGEEGGRSSLIKVRSSAPLFV